MKFVRLNTRVVDIGNSGAVYWSKACCSVVVVASVSFVSLLSALAAPIRRTPATYMFGPSMKRRVRETRLLRGSLGQFGENKTVNHR